MFHRGDVVRKLRDSQGWAQDDLAKRAGLHKASVVRAEGNEPQVSMDTWYRLATALGTTVEEMDRLLAASKTMTSPVTSPAHPSPSPEAAMDTPKTRLIHFVYSLSEEQATVLHPLVLQWFARLIGGQGAKGEPPPRK